MQTARSLRSRPTSSFGSAACCSSRASIPRRSTPTGCAVVSDDSGTVRQARSGVVQAALRVAEFVLARTRGRHAGEDGAPQIPRRSRSTATRCGPPGSSSRPKSSYRDALSLAPELARGRHGVARSLMARTKLDEAMNEAQAALRLAPRDLEIHHTVGAIYERMHKYEEAAAAYSQLRQPAAEQGQERQGGVGARADSVPAVVRPAAAVRHGSGRRGRDLHRRFPAGKGKDRRPRQGQRIGGAGLRRRHRRREHGADAADRAAPRHHAGHLHAERGSGRRRPARPAAGADRFARARHPEAAQHSGPRQEPAAARHPEPRNGKPVAARARLLDDDRLQDAQADVRQAPAAGAERLRSAAPRLPSRHRSRRRHRRPRRQLRRRHRR